MVGRDIVVEGGSAGGALTGCYLKSYDDEEEVVVEEMTKPFSH